MKLMFTKQVAISTALMSFCSLVIVTDVHARESWTSFAPPAPFTEAENDIDKNWRTGQKFNVTNELRYAPKSALDEFDRKEKDFRSKPKRVSVNPWKTNGNFNSSSSFTNGKRPWGNVPAKKRESHIKPLPDMSSGHRILPDNGLTQSRLLPIGGLTGLGGSYPGPGGFLGGYYPGSIYSFAGRRLPGFGRGYGFNPYGLYPFSGPGGPFGRW
ncbi:MAG: hypothetical protein OQL06_03295 [Gammaproteobacteria bacterium]|nr:hypothetical protein [Gammaproteobacteria bacterium]